MTLQKELRVEVDPVRACRMLQGPGGVSLLLEGMPASPEAWSPGPLLAVDPRVELWQRAGQPGALAAVTGLARELDRRRRSGGPAETGVAVLVAYELFRQPRGGRDDDGLPELVAWRVDRSLLFADAGTVRYTARPAEGDTDATWRRVDELLARIAGAGAADDLPRRATSAGRPQSSLSREGYLRAVGRVKEHITAGDIYQANLCQRFSTRYTGDELACYAELARRAPAPRAAFASTGSFALASISPETFLRMRLPDHVETHPIKGTRPRVADPAADRAAARELLRSTKDRAELLMIVDLERNDLGRICRPGTVDTVKLAGLRSFATVHHLVGRIAGRLREGVGVEEILRATFPGGSITGAPKLRAIEILEELEPVRRNYFTGCLFWFGDDGGVESSILIRTLVFSRGRALLGAGGGIVADSDPEQEWLESNHKARALANGLGFDPAEVS